MQNLLSPKFCIIGLVLMLAGCAATTTAISKRNLEVQNRMTDTIFLDPVAPNQRTIFVEIRNSSDKPGLDVADPIRQSIASRGYRIVDDPSDAQFMLQANVLQAGQNSKDSADSAFGGGFGGVLFGGAVGAGAGYGLGKAGGNDALLTVGGALLGAAIEGAAGAFVKDVTYSVITDVQISERAPQDLIIDQTEDSTIDQGSSGTISQTSITTSPWKRHRTRVVSTAEKVNLEWAEAAPTVIDGLSRSISGIF